MNILVFNCGSSSLNYKVYQTDDEGDCTVKITGKAHRVGVKGSEPSFIDHRFGNESIHRVTPISDHKTAAGLALDLIASSGVSLDAIGHRFVHGGSYFTESALLSPETLAKLDACMPLAPIHNPNSMSVITECQRRLPELPEYVSFDTTFHASLPEWAYTLPLPAQLVQKYALRKVGFHGLSYQFVSRETASFLHQPLESLRLIACHLGTGGSSVCAIQNGHSVDTSMSTPLSGLIMSTRTGDLDPFLPLYWLRSDHWTDDKLSTVWNRQSGLLGLSGFSSDIRDCFKILETEDNPRAFLAVDAYVHRLQLTIGSFVTAMGGLDALVFTDDIGVQCPQVRRMTCAMLSWCGVTLDENANLNASFKMPTEINIPRAMVHVLSLPTDEERVIALEGKRLLERTSLC